MQTAKAGSCPFRPAEKHVHNDPFSNYGAGVALTPAGNLLVVGAPTNWDNNMDYQVRPADEHARACPCVRVCMHALQHRRPSS